MSAITEEKLKEWDDGLSWGEEQDYAWPAIASDLIDEVRRLRVVLTLARMDLAKSRALGLRDAATIAELKEKLAAGDERLFRNRDFLAPFLRDAEDPANGDE